MADLRIYVDDDYKALVKSLGNRLGMCRPPIIDSHLTMQLHYTEGVGPAERV